MFGRKTFLCAVIVIVLAYATYEPLPEGWKQPWKTRFFLTAFKLLFGMNNYMDSLGYDGLNALRYMLNNVAPAIKPSSILNEKVVTEDIELDGIPARLYVPKDKVKSKEKLPGLVYYHGGGWMLGSVDMYDQVLKRFADDLQIIAVSVEYRLAPEHKFPVPFEDCLTATKHFISNANKYNVIAERIVVSGDSAGGNLAAAVSLKLRDEKFAIQPKAQVLFYPVMQAINLHTPSFQANAQGPLLTADVMADFLACYTQGHKKDASKYRANEHISHDDFVSISNRYMKVEDLPIDAISQSYNSPSSPDKSQLWNDIKSTITNPYFSPLMADNLKDLPQAYISVCQHDPLRDEGLWFAKRLERDNVKVESDLFECFHGWIGYADELDSANAVLEPAISYMKKTLQ